MDRLFSEIKARIPANKFYPPSLDSSQYLFRKRLVQTLQRGNKKMEFSSFLFQAAGNFWKLRLICPLTISIKFAAWSPR
jgi:hypothetical protein